MESQVGEVGHLSGAGVGVKEVEKVGVVGGKAMAKVDGFHGVEEGVRSVVVIKITWTSCEYKCQ